MSDSANLAEHKPEPGRIQSHRNVSPKDFAREEAEKGKISLPLPEHLKYYFSSNDYSGLWEKVLGVGDVWATYVARYPGVFKGPGQMGPFIEFASQPQNWWAALLLGIVIAAHAGRRLYEEYQAKKEAHKRRSDSYAEIRKRMGELQPKSATNPTDPVPPVDEAKFNENLLAFIDAFNDALKDVLENDDEAPKIYEEIKLTRPTIVKTSEGKEQRINLDEIRLEYGFRIKTPKSNEGIEKLSFLGQLKKKFWDPLYKSISLSSFTYWILFIGSAILVGNFAEMGIAGISAVVAFGVPIAVALPYAALKIANWVKNRNGISDEHARLANMAGNDTPELLNKAMRRMELRKEIECLEQKQKIDKPLRYEGDSSLGADPRLKAGATLYTEFVSTYGLTQYSAWILSDFFKVVPNIVLAVPFGEILGGFLIGISAVIALREMYNRYQQAKKEQGLTRATNTKSLESIFDREQGELKNLKKDLGDSISSSQILKREIPERIKPMTKWETFKNICGKVCQAFDWTTAGVFFGRLIAVAGTAIYLPAAALALSNPITVGILVGTGLIYLGLKAYQAYQKSKEDNAKELVAKINDVREQTQVAKLMKQKQDQDQQRKLLSQPTPPISVPEQSKQQVKTAAPFSLPEQSKHLIGGSTPPPRADSPIPFFVARSSDTKTQPRTDMWLPSSPAPGIA